MKTYTLLAVVTLSGALLNAGRSYEDALRGIKSHDYSKVYHALDSKTLSEQQLGQLKKYNCKKRN